MDDFVLRAFLGGLGLALIAGPLGCVIVWRRLAYFGDTLAHSALLGIALGLLTGVSNDLSVLLVCGGLAAILTALEDRPWLAGDTILGVMSHGALALGLVAVASMGTVQIDLLSFLVGDILAVTEADLVRIWGGVALAICLLALIWRRLIALTVDADLARVEGIPVRTVKLLFMLLIAGTVAIAMKVVGILLVTALLVVPAAAARAHANTPEGMAVAAALFGCGSVALGLAASLVRDLPTGPSIVVASVLFFVLSRLSARGRMA